jgi:small subunit ribosomal protein S11
MAKKAASKAPKKAKKNVPVGKAFIQCTFNNTIVTITDQEGGTISWSSAGTNGFKGARKSTPYAAQISAENAIEKAKVHGVEKVHVYVKGVGPGREQAIRGLQAAGANVESVTDITPIAHNGTRQKRQRRV